MRTEKVKIGEKEYTVRELRFVEMLDETKDLPKKDTLVALLKKCVEGLTDEEVNNFTAREGNELMKKVNELNGWAEGFQSPSTSVIPK